MSAYDLARAELESNRHRLIDRHTAASPAPGEDAHDNDQLTRIDELVGFEAQFLPGVQPILCVAAQPIVTAIGRPLDLTPRDTHELAIFGPMLVPSRVRAVERQKRTSHNLDVVQRHS